MLGFNGETFEDAERRVQQVYDIGFLPFAQLYRNENDDRVWPDDWRALARKWARPAAYRTKKSTWTDWRCCRSSGNTLIAARRQQTRLRR
jgi:hypothetical protein